jgi:hypothetical protein
MQVFQEIAADSRRAKHSAGGRGPRAKCWRISFARILTVHRFAAQLKISENGIQTGYKTRALRFI